MTDHGAHPPDWPPVETSAGVEPRPVRDAATVVLLRQADEAVEVFLMRRRTTMDFAAGMYVFPGGAHEPSDGPPGDLDSLKRTAARELWEETGVEVDPGELVFFDHWVTPEIEPRRYDTRFFAVALPGGAEPDATGTDRGAASRGSGHQAPGEADLAEWAVPTAALDRWRAGDLMMLPPTVAALGTLSGFASVQQALDSLSQATAASWPRPRLPAPGKEHWQILDAYTGEVLAENVTMVIP